MVSEVLAGFIRGGGGVAAAAAALSQQGTEFKQVKSE